MIDAGVYGNSRKPMLKRHFGSVLVNSRKHFQKDFLAKIFLLLFARQMVSNDPEHKWIDAVDQLFGGRTIRSPHPLN